MQYKCACTVYNKSFDTWVNQLTPVMLLSDASQCCYVGYALTTTSSTPSCNITGVNQLPVHQQLLLHVLPTQEYNMLVQHILLLVMCCSYLPRNVNCEKPHIRKMSNCQWPRTAAVAQGYSRLAHSPSLFIIYSCYHMYMWPSTRKPSILRWLPLTMNVLRFIVFFWKVEYGQSRCISPRLHWLETPNLYIGAAVKRL